MRPPTAHHRRHWHSQRGASLIELLVASALGLLVLAGAAHLLLTLVTQQTLAHTQRQHAEALRFAHQHIAQHVRDARCVANGASTQQLRVLMPPSPTQAHSLHCVLSAEGASVEISYDSPHKRLTCRNPSTQSSAQVLVDSVLPLRFDYVLRDPAHHSPDQSDLPSACNPNITAVVTHFTVRDAHGAEPALTVAVTTALRAMAVSALHANPEERP